MVAGALYGCAAGALLGATKLWDADWKLTAATLVLGLLPMFVAERLHAHGGGAIGALLVGVVGSWAWRRRQPAWLAAGAEREALLDEEEDLGAALGTPDGDARAAADRLREVGKKLNAIGRSDADDARKSHLVEANIGLLWTWLAQPLLFGAIGTELNFHRMAPAVAGRALLVVGVGLLVRIPPPTWRCTSTIGSNSGRRRSWRSRGCPRRPCRRRSRRCPPRSSTTGDGARPS